MNKITALQNFLGENEIIETKDNFLFTTSSGEEYYVCTEDEADSLAKQEIMNSLWVFNPTFIAQYTKVYDDLTIKQTKIFVKAISDMTTRMCEDANIIVEALIEDIDEFIEDAINADGRGRFISCYDNEEHKQDNYYIYRIN